MIWVHRPVGDGQVLCVRPGSLWAFVLAPLPLEGVQGGADGQGGASVVGLVGESYPSTPFSLRIIPGERGLGCLWWQQTRAMEKSVWGVRSVASKPCFGRCTSWHVGRPLCSSLASVSPSVNRGLDWLADLLAVVVVGGPFWSLWVSGELHTSWFTLIRDLYPEGPTQGGWELEFSQLVLASLMHAIFLVCVHS